MQFWCGTPFMKRPAEAPAVARMVDEAGYDGMICADHLIFPRELRSPYPSPSGKPGWAPETPWPDTWVLIGAMAAVTTRLRFSNAVYVAPARPLLEVAKQVATAASLAEGRVSLGVGIGWSREEFEALGIPYERRAARTADYVAAMRTLWRDEIASYAGEFVDFAAIRVNPKPMRDGRIPVLLGGNSDAALRRVARLGDGWYGFNLIDVDDVAAKLPVLAIADLIGVPEPDRQDFFDWANSCINYTDPEAQTMDPALASVNLLGYAYNMADDRRKNPKDDIVTMLVQADFDGDWMTEEEFGFFVMLLGVAGNETTRNAIAHGMNAFLDHPGQWDLFKRERPKNAADEIVRWATPVTCFQRTARNDVEIGGATIRRAFDGCKPPY